jgi:thioredoxin 1
LLREKNVSKTSKLIIVIALLFAVGVVIAIKQNGSLSRLADKMPVEPVAQKEVNQPDKAAFSEKRVSAVLPRLVDLGAKKCIPCKMMAPILEELKKEYTGVFEVDFIDVWQNPNKAVGYGLKVIPTQIFYDTAGREVFRHEGFFSKEDILAKWKDLGVKLTKTK